MSCPIVEVEHLSKNYGDFAAVRDLSFAVRPGEIVGLVGANGAGKTTTLRAVTGILRLTAGRIRVGGWDIEKEPVAAKKEFAYIPDVVHPYDLLTVTEHLHFIALAYENRFHQWHLARRALHERFCGERRGESVAAAEAEGEHL
jgi:ABC-type multidrug transport system ATPase subunit